MTAVGPPPLAPSRLSSPSISVETAKTIDKYLRAQMRRQRIPGLSLAIAIGGKLAYVGSYGVATLENSVPVSPQTVFQIGSVGKQFTAVLIQMLANEHRLSLDDPLARYLPEVPASWKQVTIRLMLNHQSGIPQLSAPNRKLLDLSRNYSDAELIDLAMRQPLDFVPGTNVSYSDTAYVLLGFVIGRVTGRFYGDLLQRRIFEPLHMSQTRVISDSDIVLYRANGYEIDPNGTLRNQSPVSIALNRTADGSLYSTVFDLLKWDRALYTDSILPQEQLHRMWQVDTHRNGQRPLYDFGYGWESHSFRGHRLVEYDGNWQGFQAVMSRYVDKKLTIILMTNLALCRTEKLAHTVAGMVDDDLKHYPVSIPDSDLRVTADFRNFLDAVLSGHDSMTRLSLAAGKKLQPSAITTLQRDLKEQGPIRALTLVEERPGPPMQRTYRVEKDAIVQFFTVSYANNSLIDDFLLLDEY